MEYVWHIFVLSFLQSCFSFLIRFTSRMSSPACDCPRNVYASCRDAGQRLDFPVTEQSNPRKHLSFIHGFSFSHFHFHSLWLSARFSVISFNIFFIFCRHRCSCRRHILNSFYCVESARPVSMVSRRRYILVFHCVFRVAALCVACFCVAVLSQSAGQSTNQTGDIREL